MAEQMKTASSSSDPSQDSGQGDDLVTEGSGEVDSHYSAFSSAPTSPSVASYYSLSSKEGSGSEAVDGVAENSENLEAEGLIDQDALELAPAVTEVAFLTRYGSAVKSDELAESEKGNSKTAEEPAISVDNAVGLTEERSQVAEVAAEVLEEIQRGDRQKAAEARGLDGVVEHDGPNTLTATKVQHSPPLVVHRWKWWNCCGLLDFVTNPDG